MPPQKLGVGSEVPKNKGRVVLRGDIVKNDFGSHAVFTEQGSPALQMTAAMLLQGYEGAQDNQLMQYPLIPK